MFKGTPAKPGRRIRGSNLTFLANINRGLPIALILPVSSPWRNRRSYLALYTYFRSHWQPVAECHGPIAASGWPLSLPKPPSLGATSEKKKLGRKMIKTVTNSEVDMPFFPWHVKTCMADSGHVPRLQQQRLHLADLLMPYVRLLAEACSASIIGFRHRPDWKWNLTTKN